MQRWECANSFTSWSIIIAFFAILYNQKWLSASAISLLTFSAIVGNFLSFYHAQDLKKYCNDMSQTELMIGNFVVHIILPIILLYFLLQIKGSFSYLKSTLFSLLVVLIYYLMMRLKIASCYGIQESRIHLYGIILVFYIIFTTALQQKL